MKARAKVELTLLIERYPALKYCEEAIFQATQMTIDCYASGGKLLVCGNGGSAADSQHIVGELMKGFVLPRKLGDVWRERFDAACPEMTDYLMENLQGTMAANSLVGENALSTAYANDQASDLAFAQQVLGLGHTGDVLLGISTSGNSKNVLYAAGVARATGMKVIGMTGETGGKLRSMCDACICVPAKKTYEIQEYHLPVYHALCLALEQEFFGEA